MTNPPIALITGAARRIGATIAETLHASGMNVVLHYHTSRKEAETLCKKLNRQRKNSAVTLRADLLKFSHYGTLIHRAVAAWGGLDIVVNNASQFYQTPLGKVTEVDWENLMNSNVKAAFFLSQVAAPYLSKRKGSIINITDIEKMREHYSVYEIAKSAMISMTRLLAKECGPHVRVNGISPGIMLWPEKSNVLSSKEKQNRIQKTALKRQGDPRDIADMVLFLVRDATYVTGQIIVVDGGKSLF